MSPQLLYIYRCVCVCVCVFVCVCVCVYVYIYIHTYVHTYIHTYIWRRDVAPTPAPKNILKSQRPKKLYRQDGAHAEQCLRHIGCFASA